MTQSFTGETFSSFFLRVLCELRGSYLFLLLLFFLQSVELVESVDEKKGFSYAVA